jgi:hypothetical protein
MAYRVFDAREVSELSSLVVGGNPGAVEAMGPGW